MMRRVCSLFSSWDTDPVPLHCFTPQKLPRWVFRNGTVVNARTYDAAVSTMNKAYTKNYWASETSPDIWDVQFEEDVCVEDILAPDRLEAVRLARMFLDADSIDQHLLLENTPRPSANT